ncbi:hypothetical protein HaLaN_18582 [Haematococcus lacustris]|uniref:Uncharacterized protein n=1 Tax=Haematococcus lacustris TaxID=44745 RepID=A0A699ZR74_HAELA|nr:hypothetical protein HaLaN_18582 [Haematococcus lacustris]
MASSSYMENARATSSSEGSPAGAVGAVASSVRLPPPPLKGEESGYGGKVICIHDAPASSALPGCFA